MKLLGALLHDRLALLAAACGSVLALAGTGCDTQAFCFDDCGDTGTGSSTETNTGAGGAGGAGVTVTGVGGNQAITVSVSSSTGTGGCEVTNPEELCDGLDNDCDGEVDNDIDFTDPRQCGNCATNCFQLLVNVDPETITCEPSGEPGVAGTCAGECAADYYDRDGDGTCEAYCVSAGDDDDTCDNKDDDCDGSLDEDVDVCTDRANCGICGRQCEAPNAVTDCVADDGVAVCDESNTECRITSCAAGYVDANGLYLDGCELPCVPTNGGVEICGDQLDNDCDGAIDSVDDDLSGDPNIGAECFGGQQAPGAPLPQGVCAAAGNEGTWECQGAGYRCVGPNVVEPNELDEMCNGEDDDCDGLADDAPTDVGASCGQSNIAPCRLGNIQCVNGAPQCVGAIAPGTETCNGVDDDCDGAADSVNGMPPPDSVGACNVRPAPPAGATSPCVAGSLACVNGAIDCVGDVGPQAQVDTCGVDQNCDGALGNQPNVQTDVANCGSCGNDCYAGAPANTLRACQAGMCVTTGCQPGYSNGPGAGPCDYQCTPTGPEVCNGQDDDCDGMTDEGVTAPPATQVCGVSPAATRPECTTNVTVACVNGAFQCQFPANVCAGGCSANDEVCDALDNDCDGFVNENVPNFGQACASDDGLPAPGHGACRRTGVFQCNGQGATVCSVTTPASCATLPGGCAERCDGIDNDCDGSVDEPRSTPGTNPTFYYRPDVVQIGASVWMHAYEASRPDATASSPGSGNGYVTSAPAGETLDATPACSEPAKVPWFNVTPAEVEQTCQMMGGQICTYSTAPNIAAAARTWYDACRVLPRTDDCFWGYAPSQPTQTACRTTATASKFCNLGAFDFDPDTAGDQDGLLPTGDLTAENCFADWLNGGFSDQVANTRIFDLTGNLREIVKDTNADPDVYRVVGGAFSSQSEAGARCDFGFYSASATFKFYDTGFRCCFNTNPDP